ncbi:hypothetical protein HG537_0C05670 [Torulaspora globosa]|uniref:NAD(P)-binding protein n=1 Tax=Torulaspora globosa TaxID=48254 RepID=A0A7H9HQA8_9SACH|nr:hypothetical protein HG537_0C05670 [Torulaspora sp. CBS 2947]
MRSIDALVGLLIRPNAVLLLIVVVFLLIRSLKLASGCGAVYAMLRVLYRADFQYRCGGSSKWRSLHDYKVCKVVITGGSSGLGRSLVEEILRGFPDVVVFNIDIKASPQPNDRLIDFRCDLRSSEMLEQTLKLIKQSGGNDIRLIVNNAGIRSRYEGLKDVRGQDLEDVFAVNSRAPLRVIQELTPEEGSEEQCFIVNVSSSLGILSAAKVGAYAASKAALIAFHKSYAFELESKRVSNIRTLLVVPGQLDTDMFSGFDPPRQFFAPVLSKERLAAKILQHVDKGIRGDLTSPLYAKFAYLLMAMPYSVQSIARRLSRIDECLPDDN